MYYTRLQAVRKANYLTTYDMDLYAYDDVTKSICISLDIILNTKQMGNLEILMATMCLNVLLSLDMDYLFQKKLWYICFQTVIVLIIISRPFTNMN